MRLSRAARAAGCTALVAFGCGDAPAPARSGAVPRDQRLARDCAALEQSELRIRAAGQQTAVMDAVRGLLAGSDDGMWQRAPGWAFRTPDLRYWLFWNLPDSDDGGADRPIRALDLEQEGHPFHATLAYARDLEARGIDFLLVPIPLRSQVYPEALPGVPGELESPGVGADLGYAQYAAALCAAGVEVVDLLATFAAERYDPSERSDALLYHHYDRHWTPRGARLAAKRVAERIRELAWYEPGPAREGDDFVLRPEAGEWRPRAKPTLEESGRPVELWFERVLDARGAPAHEKDRESPILVLGDSFLNHLEDDASGFVSHLYAELGQRLDTIAVPGGGSVSVWQALARRADGLRGKRVVVWIVSAGQLGDPRLTHVSLFGE